MNVDINRNDRNWEGGDLRIVIIDGLLSTRWTSYLDMCIAIDDKIHRRALSKKPDMNYYNELMGKVNAKGKRLGGYLNSIKATDIPQMVDIWALVHRGVDIKGALEKEKTVTNQTFEKRRTENPIRDTYKQLFIKTVELSPNPTDEEITEYALSDATLFYLRNDGTKGQKLSIFCYLEKGYSILDDLKIYNDKLEADAKIHRKIASGIDYDISDASKYVLTPDPDVIARKRKVKMIEFLQKTLLQDTTGAVQRRLKKIESLKRNKPIGWLDETSNIYRNAIYDGQGILEELTLGPIIHNFGYHLMDRKDYVQGLSFLKESLDTLRESLLSMKDRTKEEDILKAKNECALILQNLAALHSVIGNYEMAEEEAMESLGIFRELIDKDEDYSHGIAALLNSLAGIHVKMRKFDTVEKEYNEAISIYSKLSDEKPTEYLYKFVESITSLALFYNLIGKLDESIEAYEQAMPYLEFLSEKNFDDFAPQQVIAIINYASALQDNNSLDEAEKLLRETIPTIQSLNEKSPNIYNEELSTAYNNLGVLLMSKGDIEEAKNDLLMAEQLRRNLVKINPDAFNGRLAVTLHSQAVIEYQSGNVRCGIEKWKEALSLLEIYEFNNGNDWSAQIGEYNFRIGVAYRGLDDTNTALSYLRSAETAFRTIYDRNSLPKMFEDSFALLLLSLGALYDSIEEKREEAEGKFEESLDVALWFTSCSRKIDRSFLVKVFFDYGFFLYNRDRFDEAKHMWEQAIHYGESITIKPLYSNELQEILDLAQQGLREVDYILEHPIDDDTATTSNEYDADNACDEPPSYSQEEALCNVQSIWEEIRKLNQKETDYRIRCRSLYSDALRYCMSLEENVFLADFLSSFCRFLSDGFEFKHVEGFGRTAIDIYENALKEDNSNMQLRLKYIKILSDYCRSLKEYSHYDKLDKTIDSAMNLLIPVEINSQDDVAGTYAALKGEVLLDFVSDTSSETACEISKTVLEFYHHVSKPKKTLLCRFLTKAACCFCENEKWKQAEGYIVEAENIMKDCDMDNIDNRLCLGELYTLKGRYYHFTPLKWPNNYESYSYDKTMEAFQIAKQLLEGGVNFNPVLFKEKLLNLYRAKLSFLKVHMITGKQEVLDTSRYIFGLIEDLCDFDDYLFSWRAVEAYIDIVEALTDIDFSLFYDKICSEDELKDRYKKRMEMYAQMESMISVYRTIDTNLFSNLTTLIQESKIELKRNYSAAVE